MYVSSNELALLRCSMYNNNNKDKTFTSDTPNVSTSWKESICREFTISVSLEYRQLEILDLKE